MNINRDYTIVLENISKGVLQIPKPIVFFKKDKDTSNIYLLVLDDLDNECEIHLGVKFSTGAELIKGENRTNNTFEFQVSVKEVGTFPAQFFISKGEQVTTTFGFKIEIKNNI